MANRIRKIKALNVQKKTNPRVTSAPRAPPGYRAGTAGPVAMGPVSTITTAPVAIGNSIRGSKSISQSTRDGVLAIGRDFMFTPIGSGSITTWTVVGGAPLSPAAFSDSTLRQYMQMYQKFKWKRLIAHYITSSPTSSNGDIMFYYGKNRSNVFLNQTSSQLLPFVMSDEDTVLGPQWTNLSAEFSVTSDWKSTDYGMTFTPELDAAGELFLLSKTSSVDSPGYVIFDYEIEFKDLQITPRLLSLPLPRAQWNQLNMGVTSLITTAFTSVVAPAVTGNGINGNPSSAPSGFASGDIYKVILDVTNSAPGSWVGTTPSAGFAFSIYGGGVTAPVIPLIDGTTCYATVTNTGTAIRLYPTIAAAQTAQNPLVYATSSTVTFNLQIWISLVAVENATSYNPNF